MLVRADISSNDRVDLLAAADEFAAALCVAKLACGRGDGGDESVGVALFAEAGLLLVVALVDNSDVPVFAALV